jgi:hypothetical protein
MVYEFVILRDAQSAPLGILAKFPQLGLRVPFILIAKYPTADFTWLALTLFCVTPISAAFYTNLSYHWLSVRQYRQINGTPKGWRDAHGGIWRTGIKSIAVMFGALLASYICEVLFALAFIRVPLTSGLTREVVGFALTPFATFAPVILLWLHSWLGDSHQAMALRNSEGQ